MWKIGVGWTLVLVALVELGLCFSQNAMPRRILLDTDVDTDDLFALLYLLKLNSSQINLKAVTVNTNGWSHAGHAVNQIYDILYMMDRDDVRVGVGGEGGILLNGSIQQNVGGYLPIIEQEKSTVGGCRYRQAIPLGHGGMLDIDTNYGLRKSFLPQGTRRYSPLQQPTVQQVMIDTISKGATTVILLRTHTNFAIFLMNNPHLKKNIDHIYVMGGGVRAKNPSGCCPTSDASCMRTECGDPGNLFTAYTSNPYAEFNIFGDPFAAYKVFHSGIPITLVPLDATNTIPITEEFFTLFERRQDTYEAQYVFQSLKLARDTLFSNHDQFFTGYFMWDSFAAGIAASIICNPKNNNGENKFAEMEYMNITVITSNEPYGVSDGSNPFFDGRATPRFNLKTHGVHSGHVQTGIRDPFCFVKNSKGRCQDGYTKEVTGPESVRVLVATKAKPNQDVNSKLDREFYQSFLEVLNSPSQTGRFNFTTQFPYYKETMYKLDFGKKKLGKPLVFDMDMSAGDFLALIYLLKVPVEVIDLKGILVTATGWTNAAAIDIVYDVLHMMGRDDIPVGLGEVFAIGQVDCKYIKAIPHGSGGQIDSDTLYGLARTLPRSPRRYTSKNLAPGNIAHPELRQPLALEVWQSITESVQEGSKVSILSNGPLSNLAQIILSNKNTSSVIENIYVVGGNIRYDNKDKGNVFTVPSNKYSEFNILLDPYAAKIVLESGLDITLIPLSTQRQVSSFPEMIRNLGLKPNTPEAKFSFHLLSHLYQLQKQNHRYQHMDIFLGEILGAVIVSGNNNIEVTSQVKSVIVTATGDISVDGQILIDEKHRSLIKIIESVNHAAYYQHFAETLGYREQSAKTGSCHEQRRIWSRVSNFDV